MKVVTVKQMREIENYAIQNLGIPAIILMENAALQVTAHCMEYLRSLDKPKVMVVVGQGNNGGDGLAVARHLFLKHIDVGVIYVGDMSGARSDALTNLEIVKNLGLPIQSIPMGNGLLDIPYTIETCDLVVDALFGTGFHGKMEEIHEYIIDTINRYAKYVMAVDVPSGVDADTGKVESVAVRADKTVTFAYPKTGIMLYSGMEYAGEVVVVDISIPDSALREVDVETDILNDDEIADLLPIRAKRSNKGTFGRIYVLGGCAEMPGAAVLASSAVYKAGGGLVVACVSQSVASVIHNTTSEIVTRILPDKNGYLYRKSYEMLAEELNRASAIILGPGLGRSVYASDFVYDVINNAAAPMVLDADALYAIASYADVLKNLKAPCIITPHMGEMSRLTGLPVVDILNNIVEVAVDFSRKYDVITVLKDARTVVASPTGHTYINVTGNPSLAKAGTGDVLTGIIAAFIAQGMEPYNAAMLATYIHGKAGDEAAHKMSVYGVNATDLLNHIPIVLNEYGR